MPESEGVGDRRVGVRDTEICRLPKDSEPGQILKRGAKEWGAEDECSYFEQSFVPLVNKKVVDAIDTSEADVVIIPADTIVADGLLFSDDSKVQKAFLVVLGTGANIYAGDNYLTGGAGKNVWQMILDDAAVWEDLSPNGEMADGSWRAKVEGTIPSFALEFHITDLLTNVDGKIGLRIENALAAQDSFIPEISAGLKILWKG